MQEARAEALQQSAQSAELMQQKQRLQDWLERNQERLQERLVQAEQSLACIFERLLDELRGPGGKSSALFEKGTWGHVCQAAPRSRPSEEGRGAAARGGKAEAQGLSQLYIYTHIIYNIYIYMYIIQYAYTFTYIYIYILWL